MRTGLTVSILGHIVILGLGMIAFPDMRSLEAEDVEALPVELVSVDEITDLMAGIASSQALPEEAPQPKPEVEAEAPAPKPVEEPVEAVEAPPPPEPVPAPPEPEPEPAPPPEPEPAPAPPEPEQAEPVPAPEPKPRVIVNPNVPRARPEPPKQVAVAKPKPAEPKQQEPEFNADDITALLNKQEPSGGGDPEPAAEPQTIGSIDGAQDAQMTQSEIAALKARLYQCWNPPVAVREAGALVVEVQITLLPDGSLAGPPAVKRVEAASDPVAQVAVEAALRAVVQCAPFGDILRPEKYALWNKIDFVFDPREMLGG